MQPRVLIITGYGLNCEAESQWAWEQAGAAVERIHLHDLLDAPQRLHDFRALMFIGGFSFGDHMSSGHVFALRLRHRLREELQRFLDGDNLVMGICNGFQIMVKLGLLPGLDGDYFTPRMALMQNDCGHFQNFWVRLRMEPASPCVFTKGIETLDVPIRHGEGKLFTLDKDLLERVEAAGCVACRYADPTTNEPTEVFPHNPNGSLHAIAGLCDPTGRVFGMMPHPEAYLFPENHPHQDFRKVQGETPATGEGLKLFTNAVEYLS